MVCSGILLLRFKKFATVDFLVCVVGYEFFNYHVATTDTDDKFAVHDLGKDLTGAEEVVAVSQTFDRDLTLHHVYVPSELLINSIPLESSVCTRIPCTPIVSHPIFELVQYMISLCKDPRYPINLILSLRHLLSQLPNDILLHPRLLPLSKQLPPDLSLLPL